MATVGTGKPGRAAQTAVGRIVSGGALAIGVLGLLRTGGAKETAHLFVFTIHPLAAIAHTLLGLIGIAMVARPSTTRRYLIGAGALLMLWGLGGIVLDDTPSSFPLHDAALVTLHLVVGAVSLAAALDRKSVV